MPMYFWCICGEEGDLPILLLCHLESPLAISILYWIEGVRVGILVLFLNLPEGFQLFTFEDYVGCGFAVNGLYYVDFFLSTPTWIRAFIMNGCWIFSIFLLHPLKWLWLLPLLLLIWCITLIDCICWTILMTLNESDLIIVQSFLFFFLIVRFSLLVLCWGFLHLKSS